jgi:hypothetical protein
MNMPLQFFEKFCALAASIHISLSLSISLSCRIETQNFLFTLGGSGGGIDIITMEDEDGEEEGGGTPHHQLPPEGDHGPFNSLSVSSQYIKMPNHRFFQIRILLLSFNDYSRRIPDKIMFVF